MSETVLTKKGGGSFRLSQFLADNVVTLVFLVLTAVAIPLSGYSPGYLAQELITRLSRNSFLVLALLLPVMAGMGLNFGIVLGAMAGEIGLIFVSDWNVVGLPGLSLSMLIALPIAVGLGALSGAVLNRAKGREMVTSFILGFFINGIFQLVVLYAMGSLIPVTDPSLVLSRGYGVRNTLDLVRISGALDDIWMLEAFGLKVPVVTFLVIAGMSGFILWFRTTKLGQDMRAVGQDQHVAAAAGIPVNRTRTIAIILSTVLACMGQAIFLQNFGTLNTYNSHDQTGLFSIAALLVGGATAARATIPNVFLGVTIFHLMIIVTPQAAIALMGSSGGIGSYAQSFVTYGAISLSLVLYAWRRQKNAEAARSHLRQGVSS